MASMRSMTNWLAILPKKLQYAKTRVFKHDEQPTSSNIQTIQTLEDHHQPDADDAINIVESSNPVDYIDAESLDDESDISFDIGSDQIYNMDETGKSTVPNNVPKVVSTSGKKAITNPTALPNSTSSNADLTSS
ncbi:hypothetical protein AND_001520 [Anopheles darlingi]|uniref:Uncharacterized protein n=1 Tax=Anopheles darlingi TaxID=43151 RepID=W5JV73_ANODA|nr:hypothetical protein AND_001520 [Anopheles darlingi]